MMTVGGMPAEGEAPGFPAPGSSVPGAPPALKRALVPADGVWSISSTAEGVSAERERHQPEPLRTANVSGSRLTAAAAMLGLAVGLELAGLAGSRRRRLN